MFKLDNVAEILSNIKNQVAKAKPYKIITEFK